MSGSLRRTQCRNGTGFCRSQNSSNGGRADASLSKVNDLTSAVRRSRATLASRGKLTPSALSHGRIDLCLEFWYSKHKGARGCREPIVMPLGKGTPSRMVSAVDVAQYILEEKGPMDAKKLQKLTFYCQVWHLVWRSGKRLFEEQIQAWAGGPIIPELFDRHRGKYNVTTVQGDASSVYADADARGIIDSVVAHYEKMSGEQLGDLTHVEDPWIQARKHAKPAERSNSEITREAIIDYYSKLMSA